MARSQTEKQERFMNLFGPVQPRLERFVLAMTRDSERAKDIIGETILIAFQRLDTLRSDQAFLSFLFTIATRTARRYAPSRNTTPLDAVDVERLLDPSTPADVSADIGRLYNALSLLPEKQREAILLFEIAGFSTAEVRDVQGGTLVAVRVRIARARKRLAVLLGVEEPSPMEAIPEVTAKGAPAASQGVTQRRGETQRSGNDHGKASALSGLETELRTELGMQR